LCRKRFARAYGPWRPVVGQVANTFLACGVLEHGVARIRCDACAHEHLLACSCDGRYCCPSSHATRLAIWTQGLDTTLRAPVPHRQVALTIPKRRRASCLYRRRLLGEIARVAARTVTAAIHTLTGERERVVVIVACLQTHDFSHRHGLAGLRLTQKLPTSWYGMVLLLPIVLLLKKLSESKRTPTANRHA